MKNLAKYIDDLGALRAQMAELTKREKAIKTALEELKPGAYEGELFRLALIESVRETLDMDAVREKLSPQFVAAHTNRTKVRTFKLSSRNGEV